MKSYKLLLICTFVLFGSLQAQDSDTCPADKTHFVTCEIKNKKNIKAVRTTLKNWGLLSVARAIIAQVSDQIDEKHSEEASSSYGIISSIQLTDFDHPYQPDTSIPVLEMYTEQGSQEDGETAVAYLAQLGLVTEGGQLTNKHSRVSYRGFTGVVFGDKFGTHYNHLAFSGTITFLPPTEVIVDNSQPCGFAMRIVGTENYEPPVQLLSIDTSIPNFFMVIEQFQENLTYSFHSHTVSFDQPHHVLAILRNDRVLIFLDGIPSIDRPVNLLMEATETQPQFVGFMLAEGCSITNTWVYGFEG